MQLRWKTFIIVFCSDYIRNTEQQISSESAEFYRRYDKRCIDLLFVARRCSFVIAITPWMRIWPLRNH